MKRNSFGLVLLRCRLRMLGRLVMVFLSVILLVGAVHAVPQTPQKPGAAPPKSQPNPAPVSQQQEKLALSLIEAVKKGQATEVQRLLAQGADPNGREVVPSKPRVDANVGAKEPSPGNTVLMLAAAQGNPEIVKLLLQKGAQVNGGGEAGFTPLIEAVRSNHPAIVTLLLKRGAKPNQRNDYGDTALVFAANQGRAEMIEALLKKGADIEGGTGWTPLMQAAYNWQVVTVKLLLKKGARVNPQRTGLMTPLECALVQGNEEIADLIRKAGGKGRTREQIEAEAKQMTQRFEAKRQEAAQRYSKERVVTEEDRQVIEAALADMLTLPADTLSRDNQNGPDILLWEDTAKGPGLTMDDQMNSELDDTQANDVTVAMREHLQHRNFLPVSLADFKPINLHILVSHQKGAGSREPTFSQQYPTARAFVQIYLPGYSPEHDRVVLRFWMGPSPHGSAGTYYLVKEGKSWRVKWKHFAHFA